RTATALGCATNRILSRSSAFLCNEPPPYRPSSQPLSWHSSGRLRGNSRKLTGGAARASDRYVLELTPPLSLVVAYAANVEHQKLERRGRAFYCHLVPLPASI